MKLLLQLIPQKYNDIVMDVEPKYDLTAHDDLEILPQFVMVTTDHMSNIVSDAMMYWKYYLKLLRLLLIVMKY